MDVQKNPFDGTFDSLETLADAISEVLRSPVTIEDANHRLLAYSSHDAKTDPARIATIIGRRVPEKVINSLWRAGAMQKLLDSDGPVRIPAIREVGLGDRVAVTIRKQNEILGFIWVLEEGQPLNEQAFHQLKKAAQAATTKLLQLQIRKRKREAGHQEFFWQLLTGHLRSDALIRKNAEKLQLALPDRFQVLVFEFAEEIGEPLLSKIQYLLTATQQIRSVCHAVDGNQLILLASPLGESTAKQDVIRFVSDFAAQMEDRFRVSPLVAGCGSLFEQDYTQVETSYQEALAVLQIKKQFPASTKALCHVEDLGFYRYLPAIVEQKRAQRIENPHLKRLREYDREHHTALLETLAVYLASDGNVKEAADHLHIHANTLNYRLARIAEITGLNLKDMDQKVSLYIDLKAESLEG